MSIKPAHQENTGGLRARAAGAVRWTVGSMLVATVAQFLQLAMLGRLLDPGEFGVIAAAGTISGLAIAFTDAGLANAIIQRRGIPETTLSSLYWTNAVVGTAVGLLVLALGSVASAFYRMPVLAELLDVMWAVFLVTGLSQVQQALLQKKLLFRGVSVSEVARAVTSLGISVGLALGGYGPVCFAWGQLGGAIARTMVLWFATWSEWRPSLHFDVHEVRPYVAFASFQIGERLTNFLAANTDYILVGRMLGATELGIYSVAYQIAVLPLTKLNPVFNRVAFPVFAMRQGDDAAVGRGYCEVSKVIAYATVPILAVLAVTAPVSVPLLMGPQWIEAAPVVRILAVLGLAKSLGNPSGSVLLAKGRADWAFWWNVVALVSNAAVLGLTVPLGIIPLAVAYSALAVAQYVILQGLVIRLIHLSIRAYMRNLRPVLVAGGVALVCMMGIGLVLPLSGNHSTLAFAISLTVGVVSYITMVRIMDKGYQTSLLSLARLREGGA